MQEMQVRSLGQEDPLEEEMATPLWYSCLGNPMNREAWQITVQGASKSPTQLNPGAHTEKSLLQFFVFCLKGKLGL